MYIFLKSLKTKNFCPGLLEPVGAGVSGWSRSRNFHQAPAPTPTLQYLKYFFFYGT